MTRLILLVAVLAASISFLFAQTNLSSDSARVVVAIRYLRTTGTSHSHLYLYNGAGKLLRQLTNVSEGHDRDPIFSPDGKRIVFRRESNAKNEFWSILPETGKAQRIPSIPSWYFSALKRPVASFDVPPFVPVRGRPGDQRIKDYTTASEVHYPAPDESMEIVLKPRQNAEADPEHDYFPKDPWLLDKGKADVLVSELPLVSFASSGSEEEKKMRDAGPNEHYDGGTESGALDGVMVTQGSPFIWSPPLRVAIFRQHRGSTFGEGYFALDLNTRTLHEVIPTGGDIYMLSGLRGFFCVNRERYLPLGDGKRTVNCSFLDLWNSQLERIRFCDARVATFYGGCWYQVSPDEENVVFIPGEREYP